MRMANAGRAGGAPGNQPGMPPAGAGRRNHRPARAAIAPPAPRARGSRGAVGGGAGVGPRYQRPAWLFGGEVRLEPAPDELQWVVPLAGASPVVPLAGASPEPDQSIQNRTFGSEFWIEPAPLPAAPSEGAPRARPGELAAPERAERPGAPGRARAAGAVGEPPDKKPRGSATLAMDIAGDPVRLQAAVDALQDKFFAANTKGVKASKKKLAEGLAAQCGFPQPYPLNEEVVVKVAAALQAAGYRSAYSYVLELKLGHIELDFDLSPAMSRLLKKVEDGLTRGVGPPDKAPEVRVEALVEDCEAGSVLPVVGAKDAYVTAVGWLLRAEEVVGLVLSPVNLVLHCDSRDVTLRLPVSKTDQAGHGAARRLGCVCDLDFKGIADPKAVCAACAVRRQVSRLEALFGAKLGGKRGLPLFPTREGDRPSKAALVQCWGKLAQGGVAPGGHSGRRTGAKLLAKLGWSVWMIQFLGRWAASTVLGYIEEAMAECTSSWHGSVSGWTAPGAPAVLAHSASAGSTAPATPPGLALGDRLGSQGGVARLSSRVDRAEQAINEHARARAQLAQEVVGLEAQLAKLRDARGAGRSVLGPERIHRVEEGVLLWPVALWATACGWRFANLGRLVPFFEDDGDSRPRCARRFPPAP